MDFKIENLSEEKIDEVINLIDSMVGKGLYTKEVLKQSIKNEQHFFKIVLEKEKIIAYYYYIIMSVREYKNLITGIKTSKFLSSLDDETMICAMQSIGIVQSDRGSNLSDYLVENGIETAKKLNCKFAIVYAWEYNGNVPAKSLLERNQFVYQETIKKAWEKVQTLKCDKCGHVPCYCSARVFVREL